MTIRKPIFVVPVDLGLIECGNARPSYPVFNLNRQKGVGLTWRTDGNGSIWARGMFDSAQAIDFCAMISANAQSGTTIRLRLGTTQAEVDGTAPYDSGALPFINPAITREDGLYHSHLELGAIETATWWRIDIGGHTGDFQAANLVLGQAHSPSRFYDFGFERGVEDLGDISITRWGVFDETPGAIWRTLGFTLSWQSEAEIEATFRPMMEKLGKRGVLYLCFDPEPGENRQGKTYMGLLRKAPFAKSVRKAMTYAQEIEMLSFI